MNKFKDMFRNKLYVFRPFEYYTILFLAGVGSVTTGLGLASLYKCNKELMKLDIFGKGK